LLPKLASVTFKDVLKRYLPLIGSLLVLSCIAIGYFWAVLRAEKFLIQLQNKNRLSVYIEKPLVDSEWQILQHRITSLPSVRHAERIDQNEIARRFKTQGITSIAPELLPAFIEVTPSTYEISTLEDLAERLHRITGFSDIDFGRSELEKLQNWFLLLHYGGRGLGFILVILVTFIAMHLVSLNTTVQGTEPEKENPSQMLTPTLGLPRAPALRLGLEVTFRNPRGESLETSPRAMLKLR